MFVPAAVIAVFVPATAVGLAVLLVLALRGSGGRVEDPGGTAASTVRKAPADRQPLTEPPPNGTRVKLIVEVPFLTDYCLAPKGTIGTVVGKSGLAKDDNGILVDWGNGFKDKPRDTSGSRMELREVALATPEEIAVTDAAKTNHHLHATAESSR